MVQLVSTAAYLAQLKALIPPGRAWSRDQGTTLDALLRAIAGDLADIDSEAAALLLDIRPSTTTDLLPDWERVAGLPDDCSALASTLAERRAALLSKLVTRLNLNPSTFEEIGETFGVTITVEEHDQTRAGTSTMLNTGGGRWRHVWWVTIPLSADIRAFDMLSDVNTPLLSIDRNTELECRLQKASPAHTLLVVDYQ